MKSGKEGVLFDTWAWSRNKGMEPLWATLSSAFWDWESWETMALGHRVKNSKQTVSSHRVCKGTFNNGAHPLVFKMQSLKSYFEAPLPAL